MPTEVFRVRRLIVSLYAFAAHARAARGGVRRRRPPTTPGKPSGHDWTITTIFVIALSIPALLGFLTLIDIARGKHTQRHD